MAAVARLPNASNAEPRTATAVLMIVFGDKVISDSPNAQVIVEAHREIRVQETLPQ